MRSEPHDACRKGDWDGARDTLIASAMAKGEVGQLMRELRDVYTLGADCLWIIRDRRWPTSCGPRANMKASLSDSPRMS